MDPESVFFDACIPLLFHGWPEEESDVEEDRKGDDPNDKKTEGKLDSVSCAFRLWIIEVVSQKDEGIGPLNGWSAVRLRVGDGEIVKSDDTKTFDVLRRVVNCDRINGV